MKIPLTYGLGISIAGALLALVEYFLGYHNDPARFGTGQIIGSVGGLLFTIVGLVLGLRAVREATPDRSLSYGRAVGKGTLITVFSGIFGALFYVVYGNLINPEFHEVLYQTQVDKMLENGMSQEQVDAAESFTRFFTSVTWMVIASLVMSPIVGVVLSLIIGIFVKRPPQTQPPAVA